MKWVDSPGTIALPTTEIGRFTLFTIAMAGTHQPDNCVLTSMSSASVTENLNEIIRQLRPEDRWVWCQSDDHVWPGDSLLKMLETLDDHPEIDVLVPLIVKRNPPWHLLVFRELGYSDHNDVPLFSPFAWEEIPETGVFEVDAAGSGGMLIKREVLQSVGGDAGPWFHSTVDRNGRQVVLNEDVTFCTAVREHGHRIFATADVTHGHLGIYNVRPAKRDGQWGALTEFATADDRFKHLFMPAGTQHAAA